MCRAVDSCSLVTIAAAAPTPTMPRTFSVPARLPASCTCHATGIGGIVIHVVANFLCSKNAYVAQQDTTRSFFMFLASKISYQAFVTGALDTSGAPCSRHRSFEQFQTALDRSVEQLATLHRKTLTEVEGLCNKQIAGAHHANNIAKEPCRH